MLKVTTTVINKDVDFVRKQKSGTGWEEIGGYEDKIKSLLSRYSIHSSENMRIHIPGFAGMQEMSICKMSANGIINLVSIMSYGSFLRAFRVADENIADELIAQFSKYGCLEMEKDQIEDIIEKSDDASLLYVEENSVFGENQYLSTVQKISSLSLEEARKSVEGTPSVLFSSQDTLNLVKTVCDDFDLKNITVTVRQLEVMGQAVRNTLLCMSLPRKYEVRIGADVNLCHVVLHEMAHVIEAWTHGHTGHGKRFIRIYNELLAKYHPTYEGKTPKVFSEE